MEEEILKNFIIKIRENFSCLYRPYFHRFLYSNDINVLKGKIGNISFILIKYKRNYGEPFCKIKIGNYCSEFYNCESDIYYSIDDIMYDFKNKEIKKKERKNIIKLQKELSI